MQRFQEVSPFTWLYIYVVKTIKETVLHDVWPFSISALRFSSLRSAFTLNVEMEMHGFVEEKFGM